MNLKILIARMSGASQETDNEVDMEVSQQELALQQQYQDQSMQLQQQAQQQKADIILFF